MRRINWLRGLVMMCCVSLAAMAQEEDIRTVELLPFAKHKAQWQVRRNTKLTDGKDGYAVTMFIEKYNQGQERWPAIIAHVPQEISDWRAVESVEFDAISNSVNGYLAVRVYNGNQSTPYGRFPIPTNPVKVRVNLGRNFNILSHVTTLHLFQQDPKESYEISLSNVRLNYRNNFRGEYQALHAKLLSCKGVIPQELLALDARLQAAQRVSFEDYEAFDKQLKAVWYSMGQRELEMGANADYGARWVSPMIKVLREDNPPLLSTETLVLEAARGEAESSQLVIWARRPLQGLSVRPARPFTAADGTVLPATAVSVVPVGYVDCPKPSGYRSPRVGWWPDPLLVYADSLNLEEGKFQPWWLDVTVPKDQKPGTYRGSVKIAAEGLAEREMPITLNVHAFTLPDGSAYPLNVSFTGALSSEVGTAVALPKDHPTHTDTVNWNRSVWNQMLTNRIGCDSLYHGTPIPAADAKYKLDRGAWYFNICNLGLKAEEKFPQIDKAVEEYRKLGILDKACFYGFDEYSADKFVQVAEVVNKVRARYPGIPIFTTAYDHTYGNNPQSPLRDCVDWWCPLTSRYEQNFKEVAPARARGKKVWWYICCGPREPYANIFIEFPGIQARLLLGMMYQKYKPDGFLYYAVSRWREGTIPGAKRRDKPMKGAPCTNWTGNSFCLFNGDGLLFYPGEKQIVPTQRLKLLRDGMEDALYFKLLEDAIANGGNLPADWRKRAEAEVTIEAELVASMSKFTDDIRLLEQKRLRLIRLLDEAAAIRK